MAKGLLAISVEVEETMSAIRFGRMGDDLESAIIKVL